MYPLGILHRWAFTFRHDCSRDCYIGFTRHVILYPRPPHNHYIFLVVHLVDVLLLLVSLVIYVRYDLVPLSNMQLLIRRMTPTVWQDASWFMFPIVNRFLPAIVIECVRLL